jgi:hypothetical protein
MEKDGGGKRSDSGSLKERVYAALEDMMPLKTAEALLVEELAGSFDYNHGKIEKKIEFYKVVGWITLVAIPVISTLIAFLINLPESQTPGADTKPLLNDLVICDWRVGTASLVASFVLTFSLLIYLGVQYRGTNNVLSGLCFILAFSLLIFLGLQYWDVKKLTSGLSLGLALLTVANNIFKPADRFQRCCQIGLRFFHWRFSFLKGLGDLQRDNKSLSDYLEDKLKEFRKLQEADIDIGLPEEKGDPSGSKPSNEKSDGRHGE